MYDAIIQQPAASDKAMYHYGPCKKYFKKRHVSHTASFRKKSEGKTTELSKNILELKEKKNSEIDWKVAAQARSYVFRKRKCDFYKTKQLIVA